MIVLTIIRNLGGTIGGVALIAFIYFWWKMRSAHKSAGDNYLSDDQYNKYKKLRNMAGIVFLVGGIIASVIPLSPEEKAEREQKRIERNINRVQKEADAMFEKLDSITAESKGKKNENGGGAFAVLGMSCIYCGQESVYYNVVSKNVPAGLLESVVISGKKLNDLAKTTCEKSKTGKHDFKIWYQKAWVIHPKETNNKWIVSGQQTRDKNLYMQCLQLRDK